MKKKTIKKLVLAKETVRDLETPELRKVAGGVSAYGEYSCYCPSVRVVCKYPPTQ